MLFAIKRGEVPFEQCDQWRRDLHQQSDAAYERTTLPDRPDYATANDWLIRARRSVT